MLVLPFNQTNEIKKISGFSLSLAPKSILFIFGFIGIISLSSFYHSILFDYSVANWALPVFLFCLLPFGLRVRIALDENKSYAYRQVSIFGITVTEHVENLNECKGIRLRHTNVIDNQYYFVLLSNKEADYSVHYCKVSPKKKDYIEKKLNNFLGFSV